jgi:microcystin-dependent protein
MSNPFVAEIRIFAGNFAPTGWAQCDGQVLPLSQNTALFSLLGTTYGGDGKSNFALPDFRGSAAMFWGQGPGLSLYDIGQKGGSQNVTLLQSELPAHSHNVHLTNLQGTTNIPDPAGGFIMGRATSNAYLTGQNANAVTMNPSAIGLAGGSLPHNNMQPYLCLTFIIALQGVFPPRS